MINSSPESSHVHRTNVQNQTFERRLIKTGRQRGDHTQFADATHQVTTCLKVLLGKAGKLNDMGNTLHLLCCSNLYMA